MSRRPDHSFRYTALNMVPLCLYAVTPAGLRSFRLLCPTALVSGDHVLYRHGMGFTHPLEEELSDG